MATKQNAGKKEIEMPFQKYQKRTGDLIQDAEIEAEAEINKKIRNKNNRIYLISLIGLGLMFGLYQGVQNKDWITGLWGSEEPQLAEVASPEETSVSGSPAPMVEPVANESANPIAPAVKQEGFPLNQSPQIIKANANADALPEMTPAERAALTISRALEPSKIFATSQPVQPQPVQAQPAPPETTPKTLASAAPVAGKTHFIQLGAFLIKGNADQLLKKLESKGFSAFMQTRTIKAAMHVVFIGGFSDQSSGEMLINDLESKGFKPFMKENANGGYDLILGKYVFENSAKDFRKDLNKQGILTNIKKMRIEAKQFVVRMGGLPSKDAALQQQKELEANGFKTALIGLSSKSI